MKYNIELSKILDKHLPANGQGTEREVLRMNLHRDICDLINLLTIPVVVGQSEQLKAFADWLQSDTANLNYDFKDLVDEYLKSL